MITPAIWCAPSKPISDDDIMYPDLSKASISRTREYSKHFWQPDITRIILTEVENEFK